MLFKLIFEFLCDVALVQLGVTAVGGYVVADYATKDNIVLSKNYANEAIIWEWGDNPETFNFQDFIGLSVEEVLSLIPDAQEKRKFFIFLFFLFSFLFSIFGFIHLKEYRKFRSDNQ